MENFIPFIIGIAFFLYKTWVNFQAEQNKAKKRNPSVPPVQETRKPQAVDKPTKPVTSKNPDPFLIEEISDPNNPYEPKYKHLYQREKPVPKTIVEKNIKEPTQEQNLYIEGYNPENVAEEVRRNRSIHQKHNHNKKLQVQEDDDGSYHFDMKDAIIKEAILNRPNY